MIRIVFTLLVFFFIQTALVSQDTMAYQGDSLSLDSFVVKTFQYPSPVVQTKVEPIVLEKGQNREKNEPQSTWIFVVFFFQAALIAFIRYLYYADYISIFRSSLNLTFAHQRFRDLETVIPFSSVLLNLNLYISMSFVVYFLFNTYYNEELQGIGLFTVILLIVVFVDLIRKAVVIVLSFLLNIKKELLFIHFNTNLLLKIFGIVVMPVLFIAAFIHESVSNYFILAALFVFLLVIIFKYFKAMNIIKPFVQSYLFYIIIYICTLELAPVFFLVKLFKIYF
jgi:Domain of unknown function (DUF4271)